MPEIKAQAMHKSFGIGPDHHFRQSFKAPSIYFGLVGQTMATYLQVAERLGASADTGAYMAPSQFPSVSVLHLFLFLLPCLCSRCMYMHVHKLHMYETSISISI